MFKNNKKLALIALGLMTSVCHADVTQDDVAYSFSPYADGFPSVSGLEEGVVINQGNVDQFKDYIDEGTYKFIKQGEYEITVAKPIDFKLHEKYIEASLNNTNVKLGADGNLKNYVNGRPFPYKPRQDDPDAGKKLIWNFQYGRVWGDLGCQHPFIWEYKSMPDEKLERTIVFDKSCFQRRAFKTTFDPVPETLPNPDQLYRAIYLRVAEPFDLKDTQLLLHKYKDDTKRTNGWLYLGFQRRVRRLATGQVTDAFLGSDIMIEDFEGFNGRISDFDWEYLGEKTLLLSMWNYAEIPDKGRKYVDEASGFKYVDFKGQGNCFPDAPWMLRKVYIVKGSPKDENHPLSHRIHYIDAQTNEMPVNLIYDRKGDYWKWFNIGWGHVDHHHPSNKGTGAMIGDTASLVDVQAKHCTTLHFNGRVGADLADDNDFSVQQMRSAGR